MLDVVIMVESDKYKAFIYYHKSAAMGTLMELIMLEFAMKKELELKKDELNCGRTIEIEAHFANICPDTLKDINEYWQKLRLLITNEQKAISN
ncbi:hypothetical protein C2G38_2155613 [Gigaspora rosea]|uniref:Uncharacterized protein n=1 Tax=Gigaspora rosea TaxID=44941 RepID=A0A397W5P1_9GLOM|nr:hypothetical protein C2G38_2155613 [Gigaspora rosea]